MQTFNKMDSMIIVKCLRIKTLLEFPDSSACHAIAVKLTDVCSKFFFGASLCPMFKPSGDQLKCSWRQNVVQLLIEQFYNCNICKRYWNDSLTLIEVCLENFTYSFNSSLLRVLESIFDGWKLETSNLMETANTTQI